MLMLTDIDSLKRFLMNASIAQLQQLVKQSKTQTWIVHALLVDAIDNRDDIDEEQKKKLLHEVGSRYKLYQLRVVYKVFGAIPESYSAPMTSLFCLHMLCPDEPPEKLIPYAYMKTSAHWTKLYRQYRCAAKQKLTISDIEATLDGFVKTTRSVAISRQHLADLIITSFNTPLSFASFIAYVVFKMRDKLRECGYSTLTASQLWVLITRRILIEKVNLVGVKIEIDDSIWDDIEAIIEATAERKLNTFNGKPLEVYAQDDAEGD